MRRLIIKVLIVICIFSCFFKFTGTDKRADSKVKLLLDWWPNPNHVPLFVGVEKGFFEEEGIDLTIIKQQEPPSIIPFLMADGCDYAVYFAPQILRAAEKTGDIEVVATLIEEPLTAFMVREDSSIHSTEDFQGKSIGSFGDSLALAALHSLKTKGIVFSSEKILHFDMAAALIMGSVDIITSIFCNIEPYQLAQKGVPTKCISLQELGYPSYPEVHIITKKSTLKTHPKEKQAWQRALNKSIAFCKTHPKEAFAIYLQALPDKVNASWEREAWQKTIPMLAKDAAPKIHDWQEIYAWLEEKKLLKGLVPLEDTLGIPTTCLRQVSE